MLGFKQLSWSSVTIPVVMPKPGLLALTGGYRKTPVLQLGSDVFCDTALQAQLLDQLAPDSAPLLPTKQRFAIAATAAWADSELFWTCAPFLFTAEALPALIESVPVEVVQNMPADRAAMMQGGAMKARNIHQARQTLMTSLNRLQLQLQDQAFLFGSQATVADFSVYHCLWFIRSNAGVAHELDGWPSVLAWMHRVAAFSQGSSEEISAEAALERASQAAAMPHQPHNDPGGLQIGQTISVAAIDYAVDPVIGELLWANAEQIVLRREDSRAGTVQVHFPRLGFVAKPLRT